MAARTVQLSIDLRDGDLPIGGTLRVLPHGQPVAFNGWLQLTETVEAIRGAYLPKPPAVIPVHDRRIPRGRTACPPMRTTKDDCDDQ